MRSAVRWVVPALAAALLAWDGCASTHYVPQVVSRGELTLAYHNTFELWADGKQVAHGLRYKGLADFVSCVPKARAQAEQARRDGNAAIALSALGGSIGLASAMWPIGATQESNGQHLWGWLGIKSA